MFRFVFCIVCRILDTFGRLSQQTCGYEKLYVKSVDSPKLCEQHGNKNITKYDKLRRGNPYKYTIFLPLNY